MVTPPVGLTRHMLGLPLLNVTGPPGADPAKLKVVNVIDWLARLILMDAVFELPL